MSTTAGRNLSCGTPRRCDPHTWRGPHRAQPYRSACRQRSGSYADHQGDVQLFQIKNQVKPEWTNHGLEYTMGSPFPFQGGYTGALGDNAWRWWSSVPFCIPNVHTRYTYLPLRTTSNSLPKLRQVVSPNTQDTSKAHRRELPRPNPLLDGAWGHFQQLGNFLGRIDAPYLGSLWQDRRLFLAWWHTQQCPLKVVSLGRTSLNLTEKFSDFSVVLFRSDCMLVSEGHPMKTHKNQGLSNLLSPTDMPCGVTNQDTYPRGWGAGTFAVT